MNTTKLSGYEATTLKMYPEIGIIHRELNGKCTRYFYAIIDGKSVESADIENIWRAIDRHAREQRKLRAAARATFTKDELSRLSSDGARDL